jgi:hypothetical protein
MYNLNFAAPKILARFSGSGTGAVYFFREPAGEVFSCGLSFIR